MKRNKQNLVIDRLDKVLAVITPFNRVFQYNMKLHLLNEVINRLDTLYTNDNITEERIDFAIGNILYDKIMEGK